ncbi:hypothetical protein SO694_00149059 [Aureococcus anophagefferens]|uniref:Uncharacterized protein n=1 Tax=Aureococcus anophagefferens TaxID=44056 RepID=A0ABR1FNE6_AURAN
MAAMRLLVLAALGAVGAVELGKTTYNLNLIVERGEFEKTLADAQALLEETKRKKMGVAVQLLLRSAADKITKSFEELEKRRADEAKAEAKASAAEAARPYEAPATLRERRSFAGAGLDYDRGRAAFLVDAATRGVAGAARALGGGTTRLVLGPLARAST